VKKFRHKDPLIPDSPTTNQGLRLTWMVAPTFCLRDKSPDHFSVTKNCTCAYLRISRSPFSSNSLNFNHCPKDHIKGNQSKAPARRVSVTEFKVMNRFRKLWTAPEVNPINNKAKWIPILVIREHIIYWICSPCPLESILRPRKSVFLFLARLSSRVSFLVRLPASHTENSRLRLTLDDRRHCK
jgi:hypothetical protein